MRKTKPKKKKKVDPAVSAAMSKLGKQSWKIRRQRMIEKGEHINQAKN
jgi:hypothetical protein